MSCFICNPETFKSVAKTCFQYGLRLEESVEFPVSLEAVNDFMKRIARLNCTNFMFRYDDEEEVEAEVELFDELPMGCITVQDIKNCDCWAYQTEDYCDGDDLFKMVEKATEWAKGVVSYTEDDYRNAVWGS